MEESFMSAIQVKRLAFNLECLIFFASSPSPHPPTPTLYYYFTFKNRKSERKRDEQTYAV
jgi:hypothetical protein